MNKPIFDRVRTNIALAVTARDGTAGARAHEGKAPLDITVCLGPGRCLIPMSDQLGVACPFCTKYPAGNASEADQEAIATRIATGN